MNYINFFHCFSTIELYVTRMLHQIHISCERDCRFALLAHEDVPLLAAVLLGHAVRDQLLLRRPHHWSDS